jgi:hypothetical protein
MVQLNSGLQASFRVSKAYNVIGFPSPPSAVSAPQAVSIASSPPSHASNHLGRSTFMTRILADPAEPWKDTSDYQTQLDPQGLICTNHYEDASGKPSLYLHIILNLVWADSIRCNDLVPYIL